jgi:hypothetical protein
MATTSHRAMTRVVCRIFIKATPQAVWDAICPALNQSDEYVPPTGNGAGPTAARSVHHAASVRYFSDLITIGENAPLRPPRLRSKLVPQAQALSRGRLSPDRPAAPASPGGAVRVSRCRSRTVAGVRKPQAVPGERKPRAVPGEGKPAASQCAERSDGNCDSSDRGTGIGGCIECAGNVTPSLDCRLRCARCGRRSRRDRAARWALLSRLPPMRSGEPGQRGRG